ncbi:T9SS type A sorting domain-containing protein [Hymenobacter sp. BT523]|uniref:T9SS type A sorting domain-containing protein n=1 Tax=Hymenobacter sp. BT523 TaxID=2795725 RepID=UPI0018EC88F1|nr:T9SS type A sorting domain-containing protein [Hymenobacter sp. BT523]MBJ6111437.1 T9SS type A sorting domain-containing protein [Hymenobacter sp. BT523]
MKTLLLALRAGLAGIGLALATPATAQTVPNGNFSTWATRNGVETPTGWLTTDDLLGGFFSTGAVAKTTTANSAPYAAQLQTVSLPGGASFPGLLILGSTLRTSAGLPGGVPFTARPRNLQFYYQLQGSQALSDSAAMVVLLTRRLNGTTTVVAGGAYDFRALASSYTLATVPLQYSSGLAPDSVFMVFYSGQARTVTAGSVLRIDDISFSGTATATRDAALAAPLSIAPNPSPDGRYRLSSPDAAVLTAPLSVFDATGRLVRREAPAPRPGAPERALDLSELPAGIYSVRLDTPYGLLTRKLVR